MSIYKKVYAIVTKYGRTYAAHILDCELPRFDTSTIITKAEYRKARSSGVPSWGELETAEKMAKHDQ